MSKVAKYFKNIAISLDQFANTVCGGDPDETISSRLGKDENDGPAQSFFAKLVNLLFFWQKDHVKESVESDEGKDKIV